MRRTDRTNRKGGDGEVREKGGEQYVREGWRVW